MMRWMYVFYPMQAFLHFELEKVGELLNIEIKTSYFPGGSETVNMNACFAEQKEAQEAVRVFSTAFRCSCRPGPQLKGPLIPNRLRNEIRHTSSSGLPGCNHAKVFAVDCT